MLMLDMQKLQADLASLKPWLSHLLATEMIDAYISKHRPITATYKFHSFSQADRFLLSIKITFLDVKILNLWIPLSMRNQRIGSAILTRLQTYCADWGIPYMKIEPRPGSEGFWSKVGFVPDESGNNLCWQKLVLRNDSSTGDS